MSLKTSVFLTFVLVIFSKYVRGDTTLTSPKAYEVTVNETQQLEILCEGERPKYFKYPDGIATSEFSIKFKSDNNIVQSRFVREKTVFRDAGWYGCYSMEENSPVNHFDPSTSWVYVYIKSKNHAFVQTNEQTFSSPIGGSVVLPCRPTSPDLTVKLTKLSLFPSHEQAVFDPKHGFLLQHLTTDNAGSYQCSVEGRSDKVKYKLVVGGTTTNELWQNIVQLFAFSNY